MLCPPRRPSPPDPKTEARGQHGGYATRRAPGGCPAPPTRQAASRRAPDKPPHVPAPDKPSRAPHPTSRLTSPHPTSHLAPHTRQAISRPTPDKPPGAAHPTGRLAPRTQQSAWRRAPDRQPRAAHTEGRLLPRTQQSASCHAIWPAALCRAPGGPLPARVRSRPSQLRCAPGVAQGSPLNLRVDQVWVWGDRLVCRGLREFLPVVSPTASEEGPVEDAHSE
ncbi:hypothetical protein DFR70_11917 [Nocardia tenerifensis]|uniref:Uncharacterized protein n=1 Tax=Nocardia tenerifensis TaxID=228006 RepID=A0A318JT62_9NOCA|nr:hypothetical protein DFR70_11917 [Nocardia tenerifensis]